MKKKIMLLILVIPIILIITVFSVVNTSSMIVDVPISSIKIKAEKDGALYDSIYLDISNYDQNHPYYILSDIEPQNVSEKYKIINFTYNWIDGEEQEEIAPADIISLEERKLNYEDKEVTAYAILPLKIGKIKITGTAGNYSDSILVEVNSSKPTAISAITMTNINNEPVSVDNVYGGDILYFKADVFPSSVYSDSVVWTSSNQSIIEINDETGKARVLSSGEVSITATLNESFPAGVSKSIYINVKTVESISGVLIDGVENGKKSVSTGNIGNSFKLMVEINTKQIEENHQFIDQNPIFYYDALIVETINFSLIEKTNDLRKFSVTITLKENINVDDFLIYVRPNILDEDSDPDVLSDWNWASIKINLVDPVDFEFILKFPSVVIQKNATNTFYVDVEPSENDSIIYRWEFETSIFTPIGQTNKSSIKLHATGLGKTTLKVTANYLINGVNQEIWSKSVDLKIVETYSSLIIMENAKTFGLSDEFVFGNKKIQNNDYVDDYYTLNLNGYKNGVNLNITNMNEIIWESSNPQILTINQNGVIQVLKDGIVNIIAYDKASLELAEALNDSRKIIKTSFKVRAILGCNIYSSGELAAATKDHNKLIIQTDVWLGDEYISETNNDGMELLTTAVDLKNILGKFVTTADSTYYLNQKDNPVIPPLYYIVEFNNDVYGNGYKINAHRITTLNKHDSGKAAFLGPLNLVALGEFASVKAQDNVSFLIRTPGIIIDNIELAGCKDVQDLTELNSVGTTVEIMADDVYITNSLLKNGRNVLRVYGEYKQHNSQTASASIDASSRDNPINAYLIGSILSNAREYLLKIGTNEHIVGNIDGYSTKEEAFIKASPPLKDQNGNNYINYNNPTNKANLGDQFFVNTYVKTYMNVKDCLFNNSGIYAIGIESKFAGPSLDGLPYGSWNFLNYGWEDIPGTSYVAVLKLEGEVKIHDWKNVNLIDSSILMEVGLDDTYKELLNLDMRNLLFDLYTLANDPELFNNMGSYQPTLLEFKEAIMPYGGVDSEGNQNYYAHSGIAFYGGGKNYSILDTDNLETENLQGYKISITEMYSIISRAESLGYTMTNSKFYSLIHYASGRESFNFYMYNSSSQFGPDEQLTAPKTVRRCKIDELNR